MPMSDEAIAAFTKRGKELGYSDEEIQAAIERKNAVVDWTPAGEGEAVRPNPNQPASIKETPMFSDDSHGIPYYATQGNVVAFTPRKWARDRKAEANLAKTETPEERQKRLEHEVDLAIAKAGDKERMGR